MLASRGGGMGWGVPIYRGRRSPAPPPCLGWAAGRNGRRRGAARRCYRALLCLGGAVALDSRAQKRGLVM